MPSSDNNVMIMVRTFLLAQSDDHHLHQAAFEFPLKIRMGFYPIEHDDMIGFSGITVQINRNSKARN